jgi:prephenate dehydrogenase
MADFQITIVGLGTIGASMGLALRQASQEITIVGHDKEPTVAGAARKAGAVHRTDWNLPNACRGASMIILALPLPAVRDTLAAIAPDLAEGCLVTDTAPLKAPVLAWVKELLPDHAAFVGGNPAGARGQSGEPRADLFKGTAYCLCPEASTPPEAVDRAADLATALEATPHYIDAAEHDGMMAVLSQLPFLLSAGALQAASAGAGWRDMTRLGGARFERLLDLMGDGAAADLATAAANAENVGRWLERMQATLGDLRALLAKEPTALEAEMKQLLAARAEWDRHGEEAPTPMPERASTLRRLFLGRG